MRKIDWYIIKKLFVTFFFVLMILTVVAIAVDSSEKTDDFVKANLGFSGLIKNYYLGFVPWIWSMLFPFFVFIAVIFFTSKMAMRSEIIAILASGTSFNRFLRPYLIGSIVLGGLLWLGSRYWIPKAMTIRSNFQTRYIDKNDPSKNLNYGGCYQCYYLRIDSNTFIGMRDFDTSTKTGRVFFLEKIKNNKVFYNLRAELLRWDTAVSKWQLVNAAERVVDSMGEKLTYHPTYNLDIRLHPSELRKDYYLKDKLTTPELVRYIKQEESRGTEGLNTLKVERHKRTATPAAVLLLTLFGAVVSSRKIRGGMGMHLALGFVVAIIFVFLDRFSTVFATKGHFPPFLAAWLPNILFTIVAILMYRKAPK